MSSITQLPDAPSRSDAPADFIEKADALLAALALLVSEVNAATAGFDVTKWITGTTYAIGDLTWSPTDYLTYRRKTAGAGSTDPSADSTNWALASEPADPSICQFRLTLTTGVPVTTSDVTGATTIYCAPYTGNQIALWDGNRWQVRTSAQFSLALGTLSSGKPYDVFCYDNAGTPTLEFLVWTNDSTRATALTTQNGVLVKSGDATRRYLGTFYTASTTTTEDSLAKRYLWNYYNRVARVLQRNEGTASWTYTTNTLRQANAAAANQVEAMIGWAEDELELFLSCMSSNGTGAQATVGIGVDSTSVNSASIFRAGDMFGVNNYSHSDATYKTIPAAGRHYYAWLEKSTAAGTTTWYGTLDAKSGLIGTVRA